MPTVLIDLHFSKRKKNPYLIPPDMHIIKIGTKLSAIINETYNPKRPICAAISTETNTHKVYAAKIFIMTDDISAEKMDEFSKDEDKIKDMLKKILATKQISQADIAASNAAFKALMADPGHVIVQSDASKSLSKKKLKRSLSRTTKSSVSPPLTGGSAIAVSTTQQRRQKQQSQQEWPQDILSFIPKDYDPKEYLQQLRKLTKIFPGLKPQQAKRLFQQHDNDAQAVANHLLQTQEFDRLNRLKSKLSWDDDDDFTTIQEGRKNISRIVRTSDKTTLFHVLKRIPLPEEEVRKKIDEKLKTTSYNQLLSILIDVLTREELTRMIISHAR